MNRDANTIKIASLNVNSVNDRNRMRQVITQMQTEQVSILMLQDRNDSGQSPFDCHFSLFRVSVNA